MVQHRVQIDALALLHVFLSDRIPVAIETSSGVEAQVHFLFGAIRLHDHSVHHLVEADHRAADERDIFFRQWRQIQKGIVVLWVPRLRGGGGGRGWRRRRSPRREAGWTLRLPDVGKSRRKNCQREKV